MTDREPGPTVDDAPVAPPIPSFESLRGPRRRSAIDLLLPPAEPAAPVDEAPAFHEAPAVDQAPAVPAVDEAPVAPAPALRPAEWADLWRLGSRAARYLTGRLCSLLGG